MGGREGGMGAGGRLGSAVVTVATAEPLNHVRKPRRKQETQATWERAEKTRGCRAKEARARARKTTVGLQTSK